MTSTLCGQYTQWKRGKRGRMLGLRSANQKLEGAMAIDRPQRRMTLRQQMTHSEKIVRDLVEHIHSVLLPREVDYRDLTRPVRRKSHYPTLMALHNALNKLQDAGAEAHGMAEYLLEQFGEIREHARRERINRR